MTLQDFSWDAFRKTGGIDAYLLYKEVENSRQRDEKLWIALRQEGSSQGVQTTERQTVC